MAPSLHRYADRLGLGAAWLCAIHCALWPLALALLPALGVWGRAGLEQAFVVFATVLGVSSLTLGFRRHRTFRAFWFLFPGLFLLVAGAATHLHENVVLHAVTMTAGGVLVGIAHLVNLRLIHGHVHDASCGHLPPGIELSHGHHDQATSHAGQRRMERAPAPFA